MTKSAKPELTAQQVIDSEKPWFDYTRNLLSLAALWVALIVAWKTLYGPDPLIPSETNQQGCVLASVGFATLGIYGALVTIRFLEMTVNLIQVISRKISSGMPGWIAWPFVLLLTASGGVVVLAFFTLLIALVQV
jgi:hypothetical protein